MEGCTARCGNHLTAASPDEDPLHLRSVVSDLLSDDQVREQVEQACRNMVERLLGDHTEAISALVDEAREAYDQIMESGSAPTHDPARAYPRRIVHRPGTDPIPLDKHLYAAGSTGTFTATLNDLEQQVIAAEIVSEDVVGWLRNVDRQKWAVGIPRSSGHMVYPDFLVVRREGKESRCGLTRPAQLRDGR